MGAKSQPHSQSLAASGVVDGQLTDRALRALLKHHESSDGKKEQLLGNDLDVQVQFTLARIPGNSSPKPIRIEIPHPLVKLSSSDHNDDNDMDEDGDNLQDVEACIIVKEESKPWVQEMITRFPTQLGCIKKVLGLQSLRTKHKSYTQKRELLERFNVFLADDRILPMLTKALGGKFFDKKKQPVPIKLTRKEALPFAVERSLKSTFMVLSAGTCVTVRAGNTAMSPTKLLSNIQSICTQVPTKVPRKWSNIRSISIKTSSSVALPIYNKTPEELEQIRKMAKEDSKQQFEQKKEEEEKVEEEGKKKRKMAAASTPLAKALKKHKAEEEEKLKEKIVEVAKKSAKKKKRKESVDDKDAEEETKMTPAKTPKSSKKKRKESIDDEEAAVVKETKTPKSSKKKRKESADSKEDEAPKETAKTPKSTKKQKAKTPKKASDDEPVAEDNAKDFIRSKKFDGAKKGYVFKKGMNGCGYYKDVLPVVDKSWLATLGKKKAAGGRKSMGTGMKKRKGGRGGRRSF